MCCEITKAMFVKLAVLMEHKWTANVAGKDSALKIKQALWGV